MTRNFTVSDVLGIVAIIVAVIGLIFEPLILGIVAIVIALIGLYMDRKNILCIIGLILGIILVIIGVVMLILHLSKTPLGQAKK